MIRAVLLAAVLLTAACSHTVDVAGREVPVTFVDEQHWSLRRREVRLMQKEIDRALTLDGAEFKFPPTEFIVWDRGELPLQWMPKGNWLVGYWWARDGQSVIHVCTLSVLRHELHHARSGPGHSGPKWDEIEDERFGD